MEKKSYTIELKCLFCGSILKGDAEKEYSSGDMLKCQNCKELNDFDSLISVVEEEGASHAANYAKNEILKILKKGFKK